MDLSNQLLTFLSAVGIPPLWALVIAGVGGWLLKKHLPNLRLPSLPSKPEPQPEPTPTPLPDSPLLPNLPRLDKLLRWLMELLAAGKTEEAKVVSAAIETEFGVKVESKA